MSHLETTNTHQRTKTTRCMLPDTQSACWQTGRVPDLNGLEGNGGCRWIPGPRAARRRARQGATPESCIWLCTQVGLHFTPGEAGEAGRQAILEEDGLCMGQRRHSGERRAGRREAVGKGWRVEAVGQRLSQDGSRRDMYLSREGKLAPLLGLRVLPVVRTGSDDSAPHLLCTVDSTSPLVATPQRATRRKEEGEDAEASQPRPPGPPPARPFQLHVAETPLPRTLSLASPQQVQEKPSPAFTRPGHPTLSHRCSRPCLGPHCMSRPAQHVRRRTLQQNLSQEEVWGYLRSRTSWELSGQGPQTGHCSHAFPCCPQGSPISTLFYSCT